MTKLLIKNALIVDPVRNAEEQGDLLILDGLLAAVGGTIDADAEILDATGLIAMPGLVDMHVHFRDPGQTHKEDLFSGAEAAAAGGVTAVACMPNTTPPLDSPELVADVIARAKQGGAKTRIHPVATITRGMKGTELSDYAALKAAGAVAVSDDGRPVADAAVLLEGMRSAKQIGLPVISHCEDLAIIAGGIMHKGSVSDALGVKGMDRASEDSITAREIALAAASGTSIHIAHVSTAGSAALIRDAKARGVSVTAETCPHYFLLTQEELSRRDADYRMNPPLREESDRLAILEALRDGVFDCITTDHAPHASREKEDFLTAPNGIVGLETSFAAALTGLYHTRILSLSTIVRLMSTNPAAILGLPGGMWITGAPADIALADPNREWTVEPEKLHSRSTNTAFKGMRLKGRIVTTILGGQIVYRLS